MTGESTEGLRKRDEFLMSEPGETTGVAWHALDRTQVEAAWGTTELGLTSSVAKARLTRYGPNRLPELPPPNDLQLLLKQFASPLIAILLIAAVVTAILGDYIDTGVIAVVLIVDAAIGFVQERQAERSVRALTRLLAPRARVVRDRTDWDLESRELVPGDVVLLESGTRVPADLWLAATTSLLIDESLLTGESMPVLKQADPVPVAAPLADRTNLAFSGTVVASGRGWGYVVETGEATVLGAIARQVRQTPTLETPLQQRMTGLARQITLVVTVAAVLAFGVGILRGEPSGEMFKVAVALAVAAVPEGLPVIVTIVLAVGVRRMARRQAILRHLPAVETLGSTTVIGSDKTGTLTENRQTVQAIWADGTITPLADLPPLSASYSESLGSGVRCSPLELTLLTGVLANEATLARTADGFEVHGDPTEAALLMAAQTCGLEPEEARSAWPVFAEIPFEPERQYSASVRTHEGVYEVFVKGAPERVLAMCESMLTAKGAVPLDAVMIQAAAHNLAGRGLRVLAMAYRRLPHQPTSLDAAGEPARLTFVGLQGMMDPPRAGVREAIARCQEAGIRVIMITGDHAATAFAISRDLGIGRNDRVLTGIELAMLDEGALQAVVRDVDVYARIAPEQKLRIVRALQAHGEIVAVTGDGVNDAPALKAADIGVAMGRSGTDVAREAAEMVLADDNFITIVNAVEEGRVTFDNLRRTTFFLIATGAAEVLIILGALALGWPAPLVPAQILWLNLVTDGLEDEALAFEPGEPDILRRPPRSPREGIISPLLWERTVLTALVIAVGTLALFHWELDRSGSLLQAQTVALTTLVIFEAFQAGNARSEQRSLFRLNPFSNRFLLVGTVVAVGIHFAALYFPPTQFVLRVTPVDIAAWMRIILVAATVILAVELHKWLRRRSPQLLARHTHGA